jgi:hypothetical protein
MRENWRQSGIVVAQVLHLQSHIDSLSTLLDSQQTDQARAEQFQDQVRVDLQFWCHSHWHVGGEVRYYLSHFSAHKTPYRVAPTEAGTTVFHCLACRTRLEFATIKEAAEYCAERSPHVARLLSEEAIRSQLLRTWDLLSRLDYNCDIRISCIGRAVRRLSEIKFAKQEQLEHFVGKPADEIGWTTVIGQLIERVHTPHPNTGWEPPT